MVLFYNVFALDGLTEAVAVEGYYNDARKLQSVTKMKCEDTSGCYKNEAGEGVGHARAHAGVLRHRPYFLALAA